MAPAFVVGEPISVLGENDGAIFLEVLKKRLGSEVDFGKTSKVYYSAELPETAWHDLLDRVEVEMGDGLSPRLWALRDYKGAYIPQLSAEAAAIKIPLGLGSHTLICLGRDGLKKELIRFAKTLELPTREDDVAAYFNRDVYNDDEGYDICAYCQLMLALIESERRDQPIWLL
jgi:hypothetical protein